MLTQAENRFYRTAADQAEIPQQVECPGIGCRMPAWKLPDGAVYCPESRSIIPEDPDEVPVLPREYIADPERLLTVVHVSAEAHGRHWHQPSYETQVQAAGLLLATVFPTPTVAEDPEMGAAAEAAEAAGRLVELTRQRKPYCWDCKDDPNWPNHPACGDAACGCPCQDEGGSR